MGPGVRRAEGPRGEGADCKLKGRWKCWKKAFRILPQISSLFHITCITQTSGPLAAWAGTSRTLPGHHVHEQPGVRNTSVPAAQLWSTFRGDSCGLASVSPVAAGTRRKQIRHPGTSSPLTHFNRNQDVNRTHNVIWKNEHPLSKGCNP